MKTSFSQIVKLALLPLISLLVLGGFYSYTIPKQNMPVAIRGVMDVSDWNFREDGFVSLNGEWEFYEGMLLTPADFQGRTPEYTRYMNVPGIWRGHSPENGNGMDSRGFGTYRLLLKLGQGSGEYGIKSGNIRMAHRLYIDGKPAGQSGDPAARESEHTPGNTPYSKFFQTDREEIEIVLQVANYAFPNGGIVQSIQFGLQEQVLRLGMITSGIDLADVFMLLLFSVYHLSIYGMRMKEKEYLYSGIYLAALMCTLLLSGEKLFMQLFPAVPFEAAYKMQDLTGFASVVVLAAFLHRLDRRIIGRWQLGAFILPLIVLLLGIVVLPYSVYTVAEPWFWMYSFAAFLLIAFRIAYLGFNKENGRLERRELALLFGAMVSLLIMLSDGLLYAANVTTSEIVGKLSILAFISFMNLMLALRFARAYDRMESLSRQLLLRDQQKDEFLANTSHELKTPLHGILNISAHLLDGKEGELNAKQHRNLSLIKDTSIKLSSLVHDLLDVVQMKHGEIRLRSSTVDMQVVTQFVFDVLEFEVEGKDVRLSNRVGASALALADENRVRQVMYNLVHNAIKHTERGSIEVASGIADGFVFISVEDTGTGISKERHEDIFSYFERNEPASRDGYTGMGLGLYISRQLVERMGGHIRVAWSEPGRGTRIVFALPVSQVAEAPGARTTQHDDAVFVEPVAKAALDHLDRHEHTVLIVDDESSNIRLLLNALGGEYNVVVAFSAKEALRKLSEHPSIDLLVLDVMMPELSGLDLCRKLRETRSVIELPILLATAKSTPEDIELGFKAGANDYVTKPFIAGTLLARIRMQLAMKTAANRALQNELAFLHAQIKPHFLYNAISSIVSFCYTDGRKAAHLLSMLASYLRYVFELDRSDMFVPLSRELALIRAYVEIEKARFGDRFDFRLTLEPGVEETFIPSLSIQPFVENAIRHGLFEKEGHGSVSLTVTDGEGYIRIIVEDDGVGMADDLVYRFAQGEMREGGIGMMNIRRRLMTLPGASISVDSALEQGTKVTVYLPKRTEETPWAG
ncbi:response regulator [Paenibacillus mesophilus]|uniref:ATP-binding protein n=1 Tax=Paenibacillus mesophilus TaxID=2582849 RepID=UPI00110D52D0|nr:ATP-binding protein [Paenibacillus mesophilus]TMV48422.1 response regulator [Paenibacillus mesophilus]